MTRISESVAKSRNSAWGSANWNMYAKTETTPAWAGGAVGVAVKFTVAVGPGEAMFGHRSRRGLPAHEVDGMTAGSLAVICHGCVRTIYGMLGDGDTTV